MSNASVFSVGLELYAPLFSVYVCVCTHVHVGEHDMPELKCSNPTSPQGAHLQLQATEPKSN